MRKVVCTAFGAPSSLVVHEVEEPAPGPGGVVLQVGAAGVNFVDALIVSGKYQLKPALPFTPGSEVAGTIVRLGDGVSGWAVGDRAVALVGAGGFADQVATPASRLFAVPPGLGLAQAACCVQSYTTMLYAYRHRGSVTSGQVVLVLGAGGGIGLAATDLAAGLGAKVIAAASSPAKLAAARASGATMAIDYEREDLKNRARQLSGGGVDVVVDPVGGRQAEPALRALGTGGQYLVVGFAGGSIPLLPLNQILLNSRSVIGVDWGAWAAAHPDDNHQLIGEVFEMARAGRIHPPEPTPYSLDQAGEALTDMLARRTTGKVALVPD
jgi:NADPH2:quinone reductase